jgi:hypothetical protein
MRKLSREYGWSALGVYFVLSVLDFPFCYLLLRYLGTDRIGMSILSILPPVSPEDEVSGCKNVVSLSVEEIYDLKRRLMLLL